MHNFIILQGDNICLKTVNEIAVFYKRQNLLWYHRQVGFQTLRQSLK